MRCPACGFENASGIKFCGECGSPLKLKCSGCGFENAPGIKFCGECGKPLGGAAKPGPLPNRFCGGCGAPLDEAELTVLRRSSLPLWD
jgi:hypothetical protein